MEVELSKILEQVEEIHHDSASYQIEKATLDMLRRMADSGSLYAREALRKTEFPQEYIRGQAEHQFSQYLSEKSAEYAENTRLKQELAGVRRTLASAGHQRGGHYRRLSTHDIRRLRNAEGVLKDKIMSRERIAYVLAAAAEHRERTFIRMQPLNGGGYTVMAACTVRVDGVLWGIRGIPWLDVSPVDEGWEPDAAEYLDVGRIY